MWTSLLSSLSSFTTMLKLVLLACVASLVVAQQHHNQHGTNHIIHGTFVFFLDRDLGDMVMVSHTHCYLLPLTDAEMKDVEDPDQLEMIEFKMTGLAGDPMNHHNVTGQTDRMVHARCHGKKITLLQ